MYVHKAGGVQASLRCVRLMNCHPGHRHNYPAQAALRGSQRDDKLEAYPKWKRSELIMVSFQPAAPVPVACQTQGWPVGMGARPLQAEPPHSTPSPNSQFRPPWSAHPVIGVAVRGISWLISGVRFSLLGSKLKQEPTHFVNHQKDRRERKPALASGQGF